MASLCGCSLLCVCCKGCIPFCALSMIVKLPNWMNEGWWYILFGWRTHAQSFVRDSTLTRTLIHSILIGGYMEFPYLVKDSVI
jgi:hypothetical protein